MTHLSQLISRDAGRKEERKGGNEHSAQIPRRETESGAIASTTFIKTVQFALNGFLHPSLWVISAAPAAHMPLLTSQWSQ